jgi:ketopantoate reductase
VEGFIARDDEELKEVLSRSEYAAGDEEFVAGIERELKEAKGKAGVHHDVAWPADERMALEAVDKAVCQAFGCRADLLRQHGKSAGVAKTVAIEVACRLSGMSQRAVGNHYGGISGAAVTNQRRRLTELRSKDRELAGQLETALNAVGNV